MNLRRVLIGIGLAALGCGKPDLGPVTVSVQAPDRSGKVVPIAGAQLTLLPFDIDSLYTALEKKNQAGPPPDTASVERLFQAFYAAEIALPPADSLVTERQRELAALTDRKSEEYREAFAAYEEAEARRESIAAARDSAEPRFAAAREAYNRARATWEASAWDGFAPIQEQRYAAVEAPRDSAGEKLGYQHRTGEDGTFTVHMAEGKWWVAGRVPVPGSVHEVYRWNVPFTVRGGPVRVELTEKNAKVLFTY